MSEIFHIQASFFVHSGDTSMPIKVVVWVVQPRDGGNADEL